MKRNGKYIRLGVLLMAMVLLGGCVKRELEVRPPVTEGYAEIALNWPGDQKPQSARFLFYDESGKLAKEVTGITSGFAEPLPIGKYRLIVHNQDAQQVGYRGESSYQTAEVFARQGQYTQRSQALRASFRSADLPCIMEPQSVYGTGRCKEGDLLEIAGGDTISATVYPELLTRQVKFRFVVNSTEEVLSMTGVLNGVSSGLFLASGKHNPASEGAVEFVAVSSTKAAGESYTATLNVFNLLTTAQSPPGTNTMDLTLNLPSGQMRTTVDLTSSLQQIIAGNGGNIPVEVPLEVTLEVQSVGGLTAVVIPWDQSGTGGGDPRPR